MKLQLPADLLNTSITAGRTVNRASNSQPNPHSNLFETWASLFTSLCLVSVFRKRHYLAFGTFYLTCLCHEKKSQGVTCLGLPNYSCSLLAVGSLRQTLFSSSQFYQRLHIPLPELSCLSWHSPSTSALVFFFSLSQAPSSPSPRHMTGACKSWPSWLLNTATAILPPPSHRLIIPASLKMPGNHKDGQTHKTTNYAGRYLYNNVTLHGNVRTEVQILIYKRFSFSETEI